MFEKISNIKIQGGYFTESVEMPLFQKAMNVVYGRNGSGKSTISKAISQFANGVEHDENTMFSVSFEQPIDSKQIFVFNEDFIRKSVLVKEEGLDTIVMLGQQVEVDSKIGVEKKKLAELSEKYEIILQNKEKYDNRKNPDSPEYCYKVLHDGLNNWADLDAKIKKPNSKIGTKINKHLVSTLYSDSSKTSESDNVNNLRSLLMKKYELYQKTNDTVKIFWLPSNFVLPLKVQEIQNLLNQHIQNTEISDRDKIIVNIARGKYGKYVNEAVSVFNDINLEVCPLCQRAILDSEKEEILSRIKLYFNKEADDYKMKLQSLLSNLEDKEPILPSFNDGFCADVLGEVLESVSLLNKQLGKLRMAIKTKLANIFSETIIHVASNDIETAVEKYNESMTLLTHEVDEYNKAVDNHDSLKHELLDLNNKIAYVEYKSLFVQYFNADKCQRENDQRQKDIEQEMNLTKKNILELEQQKRQVSIALDFINKALRYIYYDKERFYLQQGEGRYRLVSKGRNVLPQNISVGERNIMGLCYFFASLFEGKNKDEKYKNEMLIVIDDPISSFDFENKVGVISFLRWQFEKVLNGNPNSKLLVMTHDMQFMMDLEKVCKSIKNLKGKSSYWRLENRELTNFPNGQINEYGQMLQEIYDFASVESAHEEGNSIGNIMRKVLEAYFTFNYSCGYADIDKLDELLKELNTKDYFKNSMMRLILNGESHYKERIKILAASSDMFSLAEKKRTAKDVLCLLYCLDSKHLKAMLKNDEVLEVQKWYDNIVFI